MQLISYLPPASSGTDPLTIPSSYFKYPALAPNDNPKPFLEIALTASKNIFLAAQF